ncbi:unnamed protein product [Rhizophagus irregularis]|nr:unnamed protein product [Rhizophagus irregularis]
MMNYQVPSKLFIIKGRHVDDCCKLSYEKFKAAPLSSEIAEDLWESLRRIKTQFCNFLENQEIKIHKYYLVNF